MKATLTEERFSSDDWLYERKLDGERCVVFRDGRGVRLLSRNRQKLNDTYPDLVDALRESASCRFIADGEIVAFDGNVTSFSRLQQRMRLQDADEARASGVKVYLYLFDLLYLDGYELIGLPLRARKKLVAKSAAFCGSAALYAASQRQWRGLLP